MSENQEEQVVVTKSIGEQLRAARNVTGLSAAHFAEKLRLRIDYLEALEQDQQQLLPSRVFALGYLRKYARMLGLNADALLSQEMQGAPHPADAIKTLVQPKAGNFVIRRKKAAPKGALLIGTVLLLVLALLAFLWWDERIAEPAADTAQADDALVLNSHAATEQQFASTIALPSVVEMDDTVHAPLWMTDEEVSALNAASLEDALDGSSDAVVDDASEAAASSETGAALNAPEESQAAVAVVDDVPTTGVFLRFSDNCWIDVRDVNGRLLQQGVMRADQTAQFPLTTALQLVLGNASAATVFVNGRPFDVASTTTNNVARFSLTATSDE